MEVVLRILTIVSMMLAHVATAAASADMRTCRLDALSFVDPWTGSRFDVERVGESRYFVCESGLVESSEIESPPNCQGPYGSLFLEGQYDDGVHAVAHWYVIPAAPCCGWEVTAPGEINSTGGDVHWYAPGSAPLLGNRGFASIETTVGSMAVSNPLIALICAHSLD